MGSRGCGGQQQGWQDPEAKVQGALGPGTSLGQLLENLQNVADARVELGDQVALMASCRV